VKFLSRTKSLVEEILVQNNWWWCCPDSVG
jgi:hypothetical protein